MGHRLSIHKEGQWLGNEEKRVSESIERPRAVLEDHQPGALETTTEKGIEVIAMEQLLKEMENNDSVRCWSSMAKHSHSHQKR